MNDFWYLVTAARGRSKQTWELHCADETQAISFGETIAGVYAQEQICGHENASWIVKVLNSAQKEAYSVEALS